MPALQDRALKGRNEGCRDGTHRPRRRRYCGRASLSTVAWLHWRVSDCPHHCSLGGADILDRNFHDSHKADWAHESENYLSTCMRWNNFKLFVI